MRVNRPVEGVRAVEHQTLDLLSGGPPECGPAAVAAVPAKITSVASGNSERTAQTALRSGLNTAASRSPRARQASVAAATRITIERPKCAITNPGASFCSTVSPPSAAWATTPSGSASASHARVAAERPALPGEGGDSHRDDADQPRDDAVGELDQRMGLQLGIDVAVAARPVRAAEARAREAHRRAAQHDQRQRDQRDQRDPARTGEG